MLERDQAAWTIRQMSGAYTTGAEAGLGTGQRSRSRQRDMCKGCGLLGGMENSDCGQSASRGWG